ncbi:MAG: beta-ketoacyl synthase N-terminal-like domain-containing protein [Myxococcota bacterium]
MSEPFRRPVITGIGLVSAAGIGIGPTWQCIQEGKPKTSSIKVPGPAGTTTQFLAYAAPEYAIGEVVETAVPSGQLEHEGIDSARDLKHLIASVGLALDDAAVRSADIDLDDVGVIIADEHPGVEQLSRKLYEGVTIESAAALSDNIFELNSFLTPYRVARAFGLGGESSFVNTACTSGLSAMDYAAAQIRLGRASVALAAACDDPLSSGKYQWFAERNLYSNDGMLLPFSADAAGTVFGDGGAALVFEEREHALARGAHIYAEYLGAGFTQDGWRVSAPLPQRANQARAIRRALSEAQRAPHDIDVVVPHGTGIRPTDQYERRCIHDVWREPDELPACLALKSYVGHNLGGASLLEAAVLIKAIEAQRLPPFASPDRPRQGLSLESEGPWRSADIGLAVKASAAFAGYYGAVVLGRSSS